MPLSCTDHGPIFFVHVPKTGGTSVEDYLIRRFGPLALNDVNKRGGVTGTGLITAVNHLSAIDLQEMIPAQSILTFAVVRNPLTRLLSEYSWQRGASFMSRLSFSTWLRVMVHACAREARVYGNHIRPQDQMVPEGVEVFRLEDGFDGLLARLDAVTGTRRPDLEIGHFKPRAQGRETVRVHRQDVALIQRVYARDYARFGYTMETLSDYPQDRWAVVRGLPAHLLARLLARLLVWKQRRDWVR